MRVEPAELVVSTTGASAVTVISCATVDSFRGRVRLIDCPTSRSIPSRTRVANPSRSTVMR